MTLPAPVRQRIAIAVAIGASYFILAHLTATVAGYEWLGVIVGVGVLYAFALMLAWASPLRLPLLLLGAIAALLMSRNWAMLEQHFTWFYLLEHAGSNALLAGLFGSTLTAGRDPLCTRFARMVNGDNLPPEVERYGRQITVAWTAFFAGNACVSIGLYLAAPIAVWSAYANLLTAPLVALMFVGEYAVRVRVLPRSYHSTIAASIAAFWARQYGSARPPKVPSH